MNKVLEAKRPIGVPVRTRQVLQKYIYNVEGIFDDYIELPDII